MPLSPFKVRWRLSSRRSPDVSREMGQMLAALYRLVSRQRPQLGTGQVSSVREGQYDEGSRDRQEELGDGNEEQVDYLRSCPADVKEEVAEMKRRVKRRLGKLPKKKSDGTFDVKRKMTIAGLRSVGLQSMKHLFIATDLIIRTHFRSALRYLDQVSPLFVEIAFETAFNKAHCWERLGCLDEALEQAVACVLIDERSAAGYFKMGQLLQRQQRFFEAEYCLQQALHRVPPGDMLSVFELRSALKENVCTALLQSGYETSVALTACKLYRRLSRVSKELTSGEAFRQKHMWSSCLVKEPAAFDCAAQAAAGADKRLTAYDKRLKEIVCKC